MNTIDLFLRKLNPNRKTVFQLAYTILLMESQQDKDSNLKDYAVKFGDVFKAVAYSKNTKNIDFGVIEEMMNLMERSFSLRDIGEKDRKVLKQHFLEKSMKNIFEIFLQIMDEHVREVRAQNDKEREKELPNTVLRFFSISLNLYQKSKFIRKISDKKGVNRGFFRYLTQFNLDHERMMGELLQKSVEEYKVSQNLNGRRNFRLLKPLQDEKVVYILQYPWIICLILEFLFQKASSETRIKFLLDVEDLVLMRGINSVQLSQTKFIEILKIIHKEEKVLAPKGGICFTDLQKAIHRVFFLFWDSSFIHPLRFTGQNVLMYKEILRSSFELCDYLNPPKKPAETPALTGYSPDVHATPLTSLKEKGKFTFHVEEIKTENAYCQILLEKLWKDIETHAFSPNFVELDSNDSEFTPQQMIVPEVTNISNGFSYFVLLNIQSLSGRRRFTIFSLNNLSGAATANENVELYIRNEKLYLSFVTTRDVELTSLSVKNKEWIHFGLIASQKTDLFEVKVYINGICEEVKFSHLKRSVFVSGAEVSAKPAAVSEKVLTPQKVQSPLKPQVPQRNSGDKVFNYSTTLPQTS